MIYLCEKAWIACQLCLGFRFPTPQKLSSAAFSLSSLVSTEGLPSNNETNYMNKCVYQYRKILYNHKPIKKVNIEKLSSFDGNTNHHYQQHHFYWNQMLYLMLTE